MPIFHDSFAVNTTQKIEATDITQHVGHAVGAGGVENGIVLVSAPHATAGIYVNENEQGLVQDVVQFVSELFYQGRQYEHDRIDNNAAAHVASAIMGASAALPVAHGTMALGTWQRVFLLELDGPRSRTVHVTVVGEE